MRAGQDWQGREQGLAAASILAELGILAGVNKLARLPQKTRSTLAYALPPSEVQAGTSVGTGLWDAPALQPSSLADGETQQQQQQRQQ